MPIPVNQPALPRQNARVLVFERLRGWIEEAVLAPDEIVNDVEIAQALGVSRTPVREALQMLEQRGAIVTVPGRHTRVAAASADQALLVYPPLAALQALAAEHGTPQATAADVERMRELNERLLRFALGNRPAKAREADDAFHAVLVDCAQNPFVANAIDDLRIHTRRLETLYFRDHAPAKESYEQHERIISAVAAGAAAEAAELTKRNFLRGPYGRADD